MPGASPPFASADILNWAGLLAEQFGGRPSTYLNVTDPWVAWCIDQAVLQLQIEQRQHPRATSSSPSSSSAPGEVFRDAFGGMGLRGTIPIILDDSLPV